MSKTFRETMWFKLGEQDSQPAVDADGDEASPSATIAMLPIEDRYDGTVSPQDTATFGLHTGRTDRMKALDVVALVDDVPMQSLVREMKSNKARLWMLAASVAAVCSVVAFYVG